MRFYVYRNNEKLGIIYAPNYQTALERAVREYGMDVDVEEANWKLSSAIIHSHFNTKELNGIASISRDRP